MHSYLVRFAKGPSNINLKRTGKKTIIEIKVKHESESRKRAGDKRYIFYKLYIYIHICRIHIYSIAIKKNEKYLME